jgi:hypothetical protein
MLIEDGKFLFKFLFFFIKLNLKIKKIENKNQKIFSFGYNGHGELGGFNDSGSSKLFQITFFNDKKIKDFCCGAASSYILISYFFYFFFVFNFFNFY